MIVLRREREEREREREIECVCGLIGQNSICNDHSAQVSTAWYSGLPILVSSIVLTIIHVYHIMCTGPCHVCPGVKFHARLVLM